MGVHLQVAREMVEFINRCFGSQAWLTISRMRALRELNKQRDDKMLCEQYKF